MISLVVTMALAFTMYYIFLRTAAPRGGSAQTEISTTAVEMHLLQIAQAERLYFAQNGAYTTLDQLSASGALALPSPDRDGYVYSVDASGAGFLASATHPTIPGIAVNCPALAVDQSMQVRRSGEATTPAPAPLPDLTPAAAPAPAP